MMCTYHYPIYYCRKNATKPVGRNSLQLQMKILSLIVIIILLWLDLGLKGQTTRLAMP